MIFFMKNTESHFYKENGIFFLVTNFHYAFIFFMKEIHAL